MSVFQYLDYRIYLQDLFEELKKEDSGFSYRAFARMAGSSSPNFLQLISQRKLRISKDQLNSLIESLKMKVKEANYLRALVDFDHASTHNEKNSAFRAIVVLREFRSVNKLAENQYEYLTNWYNPVVRELLCSSGYTDDPNWIVTQIVPAIGLREVKKSIRLLETLELISRNESDTGWVASESRLSTPEEVLSIAVVEYHRQMLSLASESLEKIPGELRDIRSVTLGVSKEKFAELKERMTAFWHEIMDFADDAGEVERVVQINTQLFPLSLSEEDQK